MPVAERFAPSPTGPLHLGHAYSAITAWQAARHANGAFFLRIEDIDQTRARPEWERQIYEDLAWLGLTWDQPVLRQSERQPYYQAALQTLWDKGLLYQCHCNRRDIAAAHQAPQEGDPVALGPDGLIYPGTCAENPANFGTSKRPMPQNSALRLSMMHALQYVPDCLSFTEIGKQHAGNIQFPMPHAIPQLGDIVLARKDFGTSYHLSVVIDDAAQQISHVTRGEDLFEATKIHVILQHLLNLPTPIYRHHKLIRDVDGKRLAKRDDARALSKFRNEGAKAQDIFKLLDLNHRLA